MTAVLVTSAGRENANLAGAVLNTGRQIGSLIGIATIAAVLSATSSWSTGACVAFLVTAGLYTIAGLTAWTLIPRTRP